MNSQSVETRGAGTDPANPRPFGFQPTDEYYIARGDAEGDPVWDRGEFLPLGEFGISPAAAVLSYGLGIFEGLKVHRARDGRMLLFRTNRHARRFARSAGAMWMPAFPEGRFREIVEDLARRNRRHLPPAGEGSLYIRPLEFAHEPQLGLKPCRRFTMLAYCSPVGEYFPGETKGLRLRLLRRARVTAGGTGAAKAICNYAGGLSVAGEWRRRGYDDVVYSDAPTLDCLTESSGANLFLLRADGTVVTPPLDDQILAGVTRDSVIHLLKQEGRPVEERPLPAEEVFTEGAELFCTGTAWTVQPVRELHAEDRELKFREERLARALRRSLRAIKHGEEEAPEGWVTEIV